jgi:NADPH:quinone reductase-like Zn-dependent oxidoreductase
MLSPASFVFRDLTLRGFWLARWFRSATPQQQYMLFRELAQGIASGQLKARIQASFPLERIAEALKLAASGERDGKVLLTPNQG